MGSVTLATRRSRLAALMGVNSAMTLPSTLSTEITEFIQKALRYIYAWHRWPFMQYVQRTRLYAMTDTGKVTVSAASTALSGSGTAFPTGWTLTAGQAKIRADDIVYRIASIESATALTLTDAAVAALSGVAHMTYMDEYNLGATLETIDSVKIDGAPDALTSMTPAEMDANKAHATNSGHPMFFANRGVNSSGYQMIELWPIPSYDEIMQVKGTKAGTIPSGATDTDDIPTRFSYIVDEVAKTFLYEYLKDPRYSLAQNNAETWLARMVQQASVNQGPSRLRLDPRWFGKAPLAQD